MPSSRQLTPAEVLREHARRIRSGELLWVDSNPIVPGTCCVAMTSSAGVLGTEPGTDNWAAAWEALSWLDAEAAHRGVGPFSAAAPFATWNDNVCTSATEAAEFVEAAAARLEAGQ